jgi:peptidyl-prolyl cis-trans isomerase A (cyclophilin A)
MRFVLCVLVILCVVPAVRAQTHARIVTTLGTIKIRFLNNQAPKTVDNFVKLAKGEQRFVDTEGKKSMRPFYNGQIVHRVTPGLGIFMGCQWGTGRGWPGYYIFDENVEEAVFDRPGLVAMSKLSPKDNRFGSQFFITTVPDERLNKKYTIFAEVEAGMDIVEKISRVPADTMMKPKTPVKITAIEVFTQ